MLAPLFVIILFYCPLLWKLSLSTAGQSTCPSVAEKGNCSFSFACDPAFCIQTNKLYSKRGRPTTSWQFHCSPKPYLIVRPCALLSVTPGHLVWTHPARWIPAVHLSFTLPSSQWQDLALQLCSLSPNGKKQSTNAAGTKGWGCLNSPTHPQNGLWG